MQNDPQITYNSEFPMKGVPANLGLSFHETITTTLDRLLVRTSNGEISRLLQLIRDTPIPANHDAVTHSLTMLGIRLGITPELVDGTKVLSKLNRNRRALRGALEQTIEIVRAQKPATPRRQLEKLQMYDDL